MARLVILSFALALAVAAPAAEAGTLSKSNGEYVYTESDADLTDNVVVLQYCAGTECDPSEPGPYFVIRDVTEDITDDGHGCTPFPADTRFLKCADVAINSWRFSFGGGDDQIFVVETGAQFPVPLTLDGGPGQDSLQGGAQADVLNGGPGPDGLDGRGGTDTATYAGRSSGLTVDLSLTGAQQGSSEDGPEGSRDTFGMIENVTGGAGADDLRGDAGANVLDGGPGDDTLNPRAGQDNVFGGSGVDNVQARDGEADSVDCGPDDDGATTDTIDTRVNCDPPAPQAQPSGGGSTVVTVTQPSRVVSDLAYTFRAGRRSTVLRDLTATVEPGARLAVTCRTARSRRCARVRDLNRGTGSGTIRLRGFEGRALPVGAKLALRVTKDGIVGSVKTLTIRRRRAPSLRTLCLPPGTSRPAAC